MYQVIVMYRNISRISSQILLIIGGIGAGACIQAEPDPEPVPMCHSESDSQFPDRVTSLTLLMSPCSNMPLSVTQSMQREFRYLQRGMSSRSLLTRWNTHSPESGIKDVRRRRLRRILDHGFKDSSIGLLAQSWSRRWLPYTVGGPARVS
jgi:hypothetical protein